MDNFRCFPYKIGCKKSKSSLVLLVFDIVLEIIDKNIKKKEIREIQFSKREVKLLLLTDR